MKIGFIGLGVMGYHMAGHLAQKSGAAVTVYNRTHSKAEKWQQAHPDHSSADTIAACVKDADLVMLCVGDDSDLEQILLDPETGAIAHMKAGSILIDHTTASAAIARRIADQAKTATIDFLDAPVSGGEVGAVNGQLSIMVGGDQAVFDKVLPLLDHYAKAVNLIGAHGAGQLTKMVNQICIAGLVQALSEGVAFGVNAGLDMDKVLAAISGGAAGSWQMQNRATTMVKDEFDFGFAIDWMRKDLRICLEEANQNQSQLPITAIIDQFYAVLQAQGKGRQDTSSLIQNLLRAK